LFGRDQPQLPPDVLVYVFVAIGPLVDCKWSSAKILNIFQLQVLSIGYIQMSLPGKIWQTARFIPLQTARFNPERNTFYSLNIL
jgi:hypothetical protein